MECRDCARWDAEERKCLDSKVNPHNWENAVVVAQVIGLRSICVFNDYRERLVNCRKPIDPNAEPRLAARLPKKRW
jgi:hypothetical protein